MARVQVERIAVAAMIVPKDLGYAGIAGIPVQNGLYAAAAGAIVYALNCTSRHISTGPTSSLAAVVPVSFGRSPMTTGTSGETSRAELASWVRALGDTSGTTLAVGVVALTVILALRFSAPRVPGALVLVVGGLLATPVFNLDAHGVARSSAKCRAACKRRVCRTSTRASYFPQPRSSRDGMDAVGDPGVAAGGHGHPITRSG